jgi:ABC-type multidrug transport system fused ATPase/permease subunit
MVSKLIQKFSIIFTKKEKIYFFIILFLFLFNMVLETFSVFIIIPLISILFNQDLKNSSVYNFTEQLFNVDLSSIIGSTKEFAIIFLSIFFLKFLLSLTCKFHILKFATNSNKYLISTLYKKYLSVRYLEFINLNSSKLIKNLSHEVYQFSSGLISFLELFSEIIVFLGLFIFLLIFNFKITILAFLFFVTIILLINFFTQNKLVSLAEKIRLAEGERLTNYSESFSLIKEIKIQNLKKYFLKKNLIHTNAFWDNDFISKFIRTASKPFLEFTVVVVVLVFILISSEKYNNIYLVELIAVYLAVAYRVIPSLYRMLSVYQNLKSTYPATNNLTNELKILEDTTNILGEKISKIEKKIETKNLTFKYPRSKNEILKNLNLKFEVNKVTGIKGKTGSGKTTLINILSGLVQPTSGEILIDEKNFTKLNLSTYQNLIGYVSQNIFLLDNTVKENIILSDKNFLNQHFEKIIKVCELDKFFKNQSSKFDINIGDKNAKISGGQAQRIGIARALYKNPSILILDEATNALDINTSSIILKNIKNKFKNLTVILISHDEIVLKYCDKIYDLDHENKNKSDLL